MLREIAPHVGGLRGFVLGWPGLFGPIIESQLAAEPTTNAMVRTTTAVTMIDGGVKANVLPREASARVNFRLLPGDTSDAVIAHVRDAIDDPEIEIVAEDVNEASPVADVHSDAYALLAAQIHESVPDAVVAPSLVVGATDSRHYAQVSENAFRFLPVRIEADDFERVHGRDERISVESYNQAIDFLERLVRKAAGGEPLAAR
jgi:carboxypeptidase PM20D1